jgi:hypothetical protein
MKPRSVKPEPRGEREREKKFCIFVTRLRNRGREIK